MPNAAMIATISVPVSGLRARFGVFLRRFATRNHFLSSTRSCIPGAGAFPGFAALHKLPQFSCAPSREGLPQYRVWTWGFLASTAHLLAWDTPPDLPATHRSSAALCHAVTMPPPTERPPVWMAVLSTSARAGDWRVWSRSSGGSCPAPLVLSTESADPLPHLS